MTADFYPFDMNFLGRAATRIINEVKGVNRVVYDVTIKAAGDDRVGVRGATAPIWVSALAPVLWVEQS